MPKNIPSLKPKKLIKILEKGGCQFHREGKGDHRLYRREFENQNRIVPIDIGADEMSLLTFYEFLDNLVLLTMKLKNC